MRTKGGSKGHRFCMECRGGRGQLGALEGNGASASWRMLGNLELIHVDFEKEDEMWITIDSGASENVIGPRMVPPIPDCTFPRKIEERLLCGRQRDCHAEHRGETRESVHNRWKEV